MEDKVLIRYIRDEDGTPNGVVVATSRGHIGWSLKNLTEEEDLVRGQWKWVPIEKWDRKRGLEIAFGRAREGRDWIMELEDRHPRKHAAPRIWNDLIPALEEMEDRAAKYFK